MPRTRTTKPCRTMTLLDLSEVSKNFDEILTQ
jgi:hypothetical protein